MADRTGDEPVRLCRGAPRQADEQLREGIAANEENPPLNRDMQLILDQIQALMSGAPAAANDGEGGSATSFLLGQFSTNKSVH